MSFLNLLDEMSFLTCPECTDGQVEHEVYKRVLGEYFFEPFGVWRECERCNGTGEIEYEEED